MKYPNDMIKLIPDGQNRYHVFTPLGERIVGVKSVDVITSEGALTKARIELFVDIMPKNELDGSDNRESIFDLSSNS